ncbi:ribokinase [Paracholeplasma manati]|uniref:ribokinase n=1 Tax=Paracholeplasma manati TaxID=591373 RepID=UPI002407E5DE|nr:ribokinase [Paracholeplasma manati]MDG0888980.1 ribokinase [Paracholeplasma manati]
MIYVVGSINVDLVMKTSRMPSQGETLTGERFFINQGGKGANQAVAVAKSGSKVAMIGAVGEDDFGREAIRSLIDFGVDTTYVCKVSGNTGIASIWLADQDNRILLDGGANLKVNETMIQKGLALAKPNDVVLLQLEIPLTIVLYTLKLAKEKQMMTCLNPAPMINLSQDILNLTDILCVNETEYESLVHQKLDIHMPIFIQTMGSQGVTVFHQKHQFHIDAHLVNVIDTTAAGDTFIGAFIARYEQSKDIQASTAYANAAAALCVTKYGAQQSIPTKQDVVTFMEVNHD